MKWSERIILMGCLIMVVSCGFLLYKRIWNLMGEQKEFNLLREIVTQERKPEIYSGEGLAIQGTGNNKGMNEKNCDILTEYQELYDVNPDFAGWIYIEGTKIDYPVMQKLTDREYYLHKDFYKNDSYAGVPFVGAGDLTNENGSIFLYGHNMKNGTMFANLMKYQNKEYVEEHPYILLDTLYEHREYVIFAAFHTSAEEWLRPDGLFYSYDSVESKLMEYLKEKQSDNPYVKLFDGTKTQKLLFLITCSYQKEDGRFVVVAVKTDKRE